MSLWALLLSLVLFLNMETILKKRRLELGISRYNKAYQRLRLAVDFLYKNGAVAVYLFGSITNPAGFTEHSDIDIAVKGIPANRRLEVEGKLEDLLDNFEYDILFLEEDGIRKEIIEKIKEEGILWKH